MNLTSPTNTPRRVDVLSSPALLSRARAGDRAARARLLHALRKAVQASVARRLRLPFDHFDVRALTQDALAEMEAVGWERFDPGQGTLVGFACRVAWRRAGNHARDGANRQRLLDRHEGALAGALDAPAGDPMERAESERDARRVVDAILAGLAPDERTALRMRLMEEESVEATAEALGRGRNATSQLIYRATVKARRLAAAAPLALAAG